MFGLTWFCRYKQLEDVWLKISGEFTLAGVELLRVTSPHPLHHDMEVNSRTFNVNVI